MNGNPAPKSSCQPPKRSSTPSIAKRVLIVDDDKEIRTLLEMFLHHLNYDVALAANGREALDQFHRHPCDLVITDLKMPVMDGYALMTHLRSHSPHTPVVVISGHVPQDSDQRNCLATAYAILDKPFRLECVKSIVRNILSI